jgi:hypothetical protein
MKGHHVDWFERITGFKESSYDETRERCNERRVLN